MSEAAAMVDPLSAEAALVDRIAGLELEKSAAAAEQAELTVELDTLRRAREAEAGCLRPSAARAWAVRSRWRVVIPPTAVVDTSGSPARWYTAEFTTPTGARHRSKAPPLPGSIDTVTASDIEAQLGIRLVLHAA